MRKLMILWIAVILGVTVMPLGNFQWHSHWEMVTWIPFVGPFVNVRDILGNIVLFVPFGFLYVASSDGQKPSAKFRATFLWAALLSAGGEWFQVYCHYRYPDMTDVVTNVCGALVGVWVAGLYQQGITIRSVQARRDVRIE